MLIAFLTIFILVILLVGISFDIIDSYLNGDDEDNSYQEYLKAIKERDEALERLSQVRKDCLKIQAHLILEKHAPDREPKRDVLGDIEWLNLDSPKEDMVQ